MARPRGDLYSDLHQFGRLDNRECRAGGISRDLHATASDLQWVLDAFLVALAGLLLVGNGLGDRFGRKRLFLVGLAGFVATSVLAALSRTPGELIGVRALMGAFTAAFLPTAMSLVAVMFPPGLRARAVSVWVMFGGLGVALGPVIGGALVQELGWQWVFLVNIPFAGAAAGAGWVLLPEVAPAWRVVNRCDGRAAFDHRAGGNRVLRDRVPRWVGPVGGSGPRHFGRRCLRGGRVTATAPAL